MRHNVLTMSQAFAFPLPVLYGTVMGSIQLSTKSSSESMTDDDGIIARRVLAFGISIASLWLGAACAFPKLFAFGYDLYPWYLKVGASLIHFTTAAYFAIYMVLGLKGTTSTSTTTATESNSLSPSLLLWNVCTGGLVWFAIQPIVVNYPLATVPTILGKRLSRSCICIYLAGCRLYS